MKAKELIRYIYISLVENKLFLNDDRILSEDEFEKFIEYLSYDVTDWIKGNYNSFCKDMINNKETEK